MKKKKLLILISMLAVMLTFAGCSEDKEKPFDYNDAEMVMNTMSLFEQYCNVSEEYADYYITDGTDFEKSAVQGIRQAKDTDHVGEFEDYSAYLQAAAFNPKMVDYEITNADDSVTVSITNQAENRDVRISVTYTENPEFYMQYDQITQGINVEAAEMLIAQQGYTVDEYLSETGYSSLQELVDDELLARESQLISAGYMKYLPQEMVVTAVYSKGELMKQAGLNTVIGMGTVFVVLIFISFIISLFKFLPALLAKKPVLESGNKETTVKEKQNVPEAQNLNEAEDLISDAALVAVITAAIYAACGDADNTAGTAISKDKLVVRSIRRAKR